MFCVIVAVLSELAFGITASVRLWARKAPAPLLSKHLFPGTFICHFISPVSCVEHEDLLISLEVQLGKTGLENTWTGFVKHSEYIAHLCLILEILKAFV